MDSRIYFTPAGAERLRRRLAAAREEYFRVCADNEAAAAAGDSSVWHDNFAYEENQRLMHRGARRVRDLQDLLRRVVVVPVMREAPERARLGAAVRIAWHEGGEEVWFVAGFEDGDPAAGRVGYTAPLGRALVGAAEGEEREVPTPSGPRRFTVLEILPGPEGDE